MVSGVRRNDGGGAGAGWRVGWGLGSPSAVSLWTLRSGRPVAAGYLRLRRRRAIIRARRGRADTVVSPTGGSIAVGVGGGTAVGVAVGVGVGVGVGVAVGGGGGVAVGNGTGVGVGSGVGVGVGSGVGGGVGSGPVKVRSTV